MRSKVCVPLDHAELVVSNEPEGAQRSIAAYAQKNKTWDEAKKNITKNPKLRGQRTTSSDRYFLLPAPTKPAPLATVRPNYWNALGSDSDDKAEFR